MTRWRIRIRGSAPIVAGVVWLALVAAAAGLPLVAEPALVREMFLALAMLVLAQLWNLLAGHAGLVSLGQQAFVGTGAYAMFAAVILFGIGPLPALLIGGVAAAVLAVPTAVFALRLGGAGFAVGTLVVAEVVRQVLEQWQVVAPGTSIARDAVPGLGWIESALAVGAPEAGDILAYWLALALAVATIGGIGLLLRSRRGLALAAARDDAATANAMGIGAARLRWAVFVPVAFVTGLAGGLIFLQAGEIAPGAAFSVIDWTAYVIFIVAIGGIGTIEGPIFGVAVFLLLREALGDDGRLFTTVLALLGIGAMVVAPRGLWGLLSTRTGLQLFPMRRRLIDTGARMRRRAAER